MATFSLRFELYMQLLKRDVMIRYKGSVLGVLWSLINPLVMLAVYTFVFSIVFKSKWGIHTSDNKAEYALVIFSALVFYNVFSEVVLRAPGLIIAHSNYVTKVVFPLELLSIMTLGNAILHSLLSLVILLLALFLFYGTLHWSVLFFPLIYIPLSLYSLGLSWFLSSVGVFIRDMGYFITIVIQVLFFMTPIFYPVNSVPQPYRTILSLNPLTGIIDNARNVLVFGKPIQWEWWIISTLIGAGFSFLSLLWFKKSKHAFADVL